MRWVSLLGIASALTLFPPAPVYGQASGSLPVRAEGPLADSLRAAAHRMIDLLRDRDTSGLIALYGDTLHFVHVEDGNIIPWPQLSTMMRSYLATVTSNPMSVIGEPGVTLIDQNTAVLYVTHRFEGSQGRDAHEGVWTGVLRRFAAGWKIIHSHSSDRTKQ